MFTDHVKPDKTAEYDAWSAGINSEVKQFPEFLSVDVIRSGSVTLTNADGQSETFTSGDVFFIPKGTKCTWHITETVRKFYMIAA